MRRHTVRRWTRATLALLLPTGGALALALVAGCSGDKTTAPTPVAVAGSWVGPVTLTSGSSATLSLTLREAAGAVSGNGSIGTATDAIALTVTGTYTEPHVSLTLTSPEVNPLDLSGTVTDSTITGLVNGSGFANANARLRRQ